MKSHAPILALCLFIRSVYAAEFTASTAALSDVRDAVALAGVEDVVNIPSGSAVWTDALLLTNGITLRGAGTNQTTIIRTNGGAAVRVILSATAPVRVTGMTFRGDWNNPIVVLNGSGVSDPGEKITSFRVDHCNFTLGGRAVYPRGWCYGVVDHCAFTNSNIAVSPDGDNSLAWDRPIEPGSTNAVYIESNLFVVNNDAPSEPNEQIYHAFGSRSVTRFNIFDGNGNTSRNTTIYDSHGNWGSGVVDPDSADALTYRGQPLVEFHGNTIQVYLSYRLFNLRGGSCIMFSNVMTADSVGNKFLLTDEEVTSTVLFSPLKTNWPCADQITNSFFWANSLNGVTTGLVEVTAAYTNVIQENRDFWLQAPNSTNGSPAGVYASYTPLVFPHPLVTAQDGAPTPQSTITGTLSAGSIIITP